MDSSENSTTLLECRLILTRLPHCSWTLFHADWSLCCPVSTGPVRRPLPTANFSVPLSHSLTRIPLPLPVTSRSRVQNPLSGFAPKQTKELSAWRTIYIVLHIRMFITYIHRTYESRNTKNTYDFLVQVRNFLLPLSLKVLRHKERDTHSFYSGFSICPNQQV